MASEKITAIIESVKGLTVLELKELIDTYCEEFGVSAVARRQALPPSKVASWRGSMLPSTPARPRVATPRPSCRSSMAGSRSCAKAHFPHQRSNGSCPTRCNRKV